VSEVGDLVIASVPRAVRERSGPCMVLLSVLEGVRLLVGRSAPALVAGRRVAPGDSDA
jgi:hypothetical protein